MKAGYGAALGEAVKSVPNKRASELYPWSTLLDAGGAAALLQGASKRPAVFAAFALATVVAVKAMGVALAIAVALDATLVRVLVVPATMRLLGDLNWWCPAALKRLLGETRLH